MRETARVMVSLHRATRAAALLVVTNAVSLELQFRNVFRRSWEGRDGGVLLVKTHAVVARFASAGLHRGLHHSGWGGYAKMIAADILPLELSATLIVDTDCLFAANPEPIWGLLRQLEGPRILAAKYISPKEGSCLLGRGQARRSRRLWGVTDAGVSPFQRASHVAAAELRHTFPAHQLRRATDGPGATTPSQLDVACLAPRCAAWGAAAAKAGMRYHGELG